MEILSNWGNALQVGLTELQFFCLRNKKLYVSPHDLDIRNADYPGNLGALVNGKVKVSHSRPSSSAHSFTIISVFFFLVFQLFPLGVAIVNLPSPSPSVVYTLFFDSDYHHVLSCDIIYLVSGLLGFLLSISTLTCAPMCLYTVFIYFKVMAVWPGIPLVTSIVL